MTTPAEQHQSLLVDDEEAVALANDTNYGLAGGVFTRINGHKRDKFAIFTS